MFKVTMTSEPRSIRRESKKYVYLIWKFVKNVKIHTIFAKGLKVIILTITNYNKNKINIGVLYLSFIKRLKL